MVFKAKPIETVYKNYRMRSRLESRWAVFFDKMGLVWEYEKEGYELPSGNYLPDFWLADPQCWAEVKPVEFNDKERAKAYDLYRATHYPVICLVGVPEAKPYFVWGIRRPCYVGPLYGQENHLWPGNCPLSAEDLSRIKEAVAEAKAARFEFGENPDIASRPIVVALDQMPHLSVGAFVRHKTFGEGMIITIRDTESDQDLIVKFARDRNPRRLSRNESVGRGLLTLS